MDGKKVFFLLQSLPVLSLFHFFHPSSKLKSKPFFLWEKKVELIFKISTFLQFNLIVHSKFSFIFFLSPRSICSSSFFIQSDDNIKSIPFYTPSNDNVDFRWIFIMLAKVPLLWFPFHFHSLVHFITRYRENVLIMSGFSGREQKKKLFVGMKKIKLTLPHCKTHSRMTEMAWNE